MLYLVEKRERFGLTARPRLSPPLQSNVVKEHVIGSFTMKSLMHNKARFYSVLKQLAGLRYNARLRKSQLVTAEVAFTRVLLQFLLLSWPIVVSTAEYV